MSNHSEAQIQFQKKLKKMQLNAKRKSYLINGLFIYYFIFAVYYLVLYFQTQGFEPVSFNSLILIGFGPLSLLLSYFWTQSPQSLARFLIERTNRTLKNFRDSKYDEYWASSPSALFTYLLIIITLALGWVVTQVNLYTLFSAEGFAGAQRIFLAVINPNWDIIGVVMSAMIETIFIALIATLLCLPIAFLGSFFAARNLMKTSSSSFMVYNIVRFICNFARSVEPIIWAIIFSVWVGIGPFAGMLSLMIHSIVSLIKLYSEQIENIDPGPLEAIEATGANKIQVIWFAVVPQVVLPYLSYTIYRWDINVRMATVIGLVGGGGVGTLLIQYQGLAKWNEVGTIIIVIAAVVWLMDYLSAKIREAIY